MHIILAWFGIDLGQQWDDFLSGAFSFMLLSAFAHALPKPVPEPQGFLQNFYSFFFSFVQYILINLDRAKMRNTNPPPGGESGPWGDKPRG